MSVTFSHPFSHPQCATRRDMCHSSEATSQLIAETALMMILNDPQAQGLLIIAASATVQAARVMTQEAREGVARLLKSWTSYINPSKISPRVINVGEIGDGYDKEISRSDLEKLIGASNIYRLD